MARKQKLKVYRTPAGFYDAYVAASSQKAALQAWGSDADLFARGVAEQVTNEALTTAPLARPGEVIKVTRGTAAEHVAALPKGGRAAARSSEPSAPRPAVPKRAKKPSRAKLDRAEAAIDAADAELADRLAEIDRQKHTLEEKRRKLEQAHRARRVKLDRARIRERDVYEAALSDWET